MDYSWKCLLVVVKNGLGTLNFMLRCLNSGGGPFSRVPRLDA